MDQGVLVPDDVTIAMVEDRLKHEDCKDGYLLDGFPRTVYQAEQFDRYLKGNGMALTKVINLVVSQELLLSRISGRRLCRSCGATFHTVNMPPKEEGVCDICGGEIYQRGDDASATVENRLKVYNEQTSPLIAYYEKCGLISDFAGERKPEEVFEDILNVLEN